MLKTWKCTSSLYVLLWFRRVGWRVHPDLNLLNRFIHRSFWNKRAHCKMLTPRWKNHTRKDPVFKHERFSGHSVLLPFLPTAQLYGGCVLKEPVVSLWNPPPRPLQKIFLTFFFFLLVLFKFNGNFCDLQKSGEKNNKIIPIRYPGKRFPSSNPMLPESGYSAPAAHSGYSSACQEKTTTTTKASGWLHSSQMLLLLRLEVVVMVVLFWGGTLQKCLYSLCHPCQPSLF